MNMTQKESEKFMKELSSYKLNNDVDYGVAPTFTSLGKVSDLKNKEMILASQNVFYKESGAYTGEISTDMLKEIGVTHVIVGHSERRSIFLESDEVINNKVKYLFDEKLTPILCIGETLRQREKGELVKIVKGQLKEGLKGVDAKNVANLVIAYEPIWAIGTGVTATADEAQDACSIVRNYIEELYDKKTANSVRIQYGGSVKPENVSEILSKPDIDGALVGGASLVAESFSKLVNWK